LVASQRERCGVIDASAGTRRTTRNAAARLMPISARSGFGGGGRPRRLMVGLAAVSVIAIGGVTSRAVAVTARGPTSVIRFQAYTVSGQPKLPVRKAAGSCLSASLTTERADAWRCRAHGRIYDPCFSARPSTGRVVCPNMDLNQATEIAVGGFPGSDRPTSHAGREQPWLIDVCEKSGRCARCRRVAPTRPAANGQRLDFTCGGRLAGLGGFGLPDESTPLWTIAVGLVTPGTAVEIAVTHVRRAWT
jgi:hypothetical protein